MKSMTSSWAMDQHLQRGLFEVGRIRTSNRRLNVPDQLSSRQKFILLSVKIRERFEVTVGIIIIIFLLQSTKNLGSVFIKATGNAILKAGVGKY